jgi:hypothetical protein
VDLGLYLRVLWRFRILVAAGILLAVVLATLSFAKVSFAGGSPKLTYRQGERWQASSVLFITQSGFPWGRTVPKYFVPEPNSGVPAIPVGDPARFAELAQIYAQLANGDAVRRIIARDGRVQGTISAAPYTSPDGTSTLPMIAVTATAWSPRGAKSLAARGAAAFQAFLQSRQSAAGIPRDERVVLNVIQQGYKPKLIAPRKKTVPMFVFFAVFIATVSAALVLENFRPRLRSATAADPVLLPTEAPRRTA